MAAPLVIAGIVGAGLKIGGDIWGGVNARNDARRQATMLNNQAILEEQASAFDALQAEKQFESLLGEQKLSVAVSGSEVEGSVLDIFNKTISDKRQTMQNIIAEGKTRANLLRNQARQIRKAGKRSLLGGLIGGGGSAIQSYASMKGGNFAATQFYTPTGGAL